MNINILLELIKLFASLEVSILLTFLTLKLTILRESKILDFILICFGVYIPLFFGSFVIGITLYKAL